MTATLLLLLALAGGTMLRLSAQPLPAIDYTNGLLLAWPEPAEEAIVVGASSLASDAVWTPWPEPIFKRFGQFCLAAPMTNAQQFYQLVPGTQFIDDFDPLKEPFATRNPWEPYFADAADVSRFTFTITDGVFQIQTQEPPVNGMVAVFCPGAGAIVRDFYASVDILDWGSSSQNSALGIAGRLQGGPGGVSGMYLGSLQVNPGGVPGTAQLWFFDGGNNVQVPGEFNITANSKYRLQFWVVGNHLTLRLLDLTNGQEVKRGQLQDSRLTQGRVALWVNTRGSSSYTRTVDNFFMTGTEP